MKRIIVFLSLLLPLATQAQHSLYHQVGDTIEHRFPIYYYYNWWPDTLLHYDTSMSHASLRCFPYLNISNESDLEIGVSSRANEYAQYYYTNTPLKIIGIAAAYLKTVNDHNFEETNEILPVDEYLRIYKPRADSMILLKDILIDKMSRYDSTRLLKTEAQDDSCTGNYCCNACPYIHYFTYVPVHEYYFDDTLTITDSFYVGFTSRSTATYEDWLRHPRPIIRLRPYYLKIFDERDGAPDSCGCPAPSYWSKFKIHDNVRGWWDTYYNQYVMIYPIIATDTAEYFYCPPVKSVYVDTVTENSATLHWDGDTRNTEYEVSYSPLGSPAGYGTIIQVADTFCTITGIDTRDGLSAYVRAICHAHDSVYYTEWSDRAIIYDWGHASAVNPDAGEGVSVAPNPATRKVTISALNGIDEVEIFDLQGRRMNRFMCKDTSFTLDISAWERGTYMLHVHTRGAIVVRKLAVQ